jgi:hypothetical protein
MNYRGVFSWIRPVEIDIEKEYRREQVEIGGLIDSRISGRTGMSEETF